MKHLCHLVGILVGALVSGCILDSELTTGTVTIFNDSEVTIVDVRFVPCGGGPVSPNVIGKHRIEGDEMLDLEVETGCYDVRYIDDDLGAGYWPDVEVEDDGEVRLRKS